MLFCILDRSDGTPFHDRELFKDEDVARYSLIGFHVGAAVLVDDVLPPDILDFTFEEILDFGNWEVEQLPEVQYPGGGNAYFDGKNYYNSFGQQLRNPEEYDRMAEGYTPFGDEGDDYE